MQIQSFTVPDYRGNVAGWHREFGDLAVRARSWDHVFETADGTYPTHEFVASFRDFAGRLDAAREGAKSLGSFHSIGELRDMGGTRLRLPAFAMSRLEGMARDRSTFRAGDGPGMSAWASMLDRIVADLERGERLLHAKLVTMEPTVPKTPNDGAGGSRLPYPGTGPRPTPIP